MIKARQNSIISRVVRGGSSSSFGLCKNWLAVFSSSLENGRGHRAYPSSCCDHCFA